MTWGFAKNRSRRNVAPADEYIWSETFGLVYDRVGRWTESTVTRLFPSIAKCLNLWLSTRLCQLAHPSFPSPTRDWRWTSITVNRGYAAARHVDRNNHGPSVIRSIASNSDRLWLWPEATHKDLPHLSSEHAVEIPIASRRHLWAFDGRCPHETKPYQEDVGSRLSIIFFQSARGWKASSQTTARLIDLGFNPAASVHEATKFDSQFDVLTGGTSHMSWRVTQT